MQSYERWFDCYRFYIGFDDSEKFFQMIPVNEATVGDVSDELMIKWFASVLSPPTGIHSKILMKCFIRFTLSRRFPSPTILMENLT